MNISNDDLERVRTAMSAGRKIEAIKIYREASGAGLADAKAFVERMDLNAPAGTTGGAAGVQSASNDDIDQIQAAVFAGEKIKAIKLYRSVTGEGLKESKDFIDALEEELRRTEPGRFTAPAAKGCGTLAIAFVVAVGIAAVVHATILAGLGR